MAMTDEISATHDDTHWTTKPHPRLEGASLYCSLRIEGCVECEHAAMMEEIYDAWHSGSNETCEILWSLQDGYGEPGFIPCQGYDWSGIRDSSDEAVRAMYAAIHA
jgi:hypothetical protein